MSTEEDTIGSTTTDEKDKLLAARARKYLIWAWVLLIVGILTITVGGLILIIAAHFVSQKRKKMLSVESAPEIPSEPATEIQSLRRLEGLGKTLDVFSDELTITPTGLLGMMDSIQSGGITIPISSITAIQFKDGGAMRHGYLQFGILGGGRIGGGIDEAVNDPNAITFPSSMNSEAREVKAFIENAMAQSRVQSHSGGLNVSDEVSRLADLRSKGILTDEEFTRAKAKLLSP